MNRTLATALAALLCAGVAAAAPAAGRDPAVVRTDAGLVRGAISATHRTFAGIPYAAPPAGELRWGSPRPVRPWAGTRAATAPGEACWQPADLPISAPNQGDDCLNLNVTTPATGRRLPVVVVFHGGSFTYGAGSDYQSDALAANGLVVVTINYRLGALGFLAHPALDGGAAAHGSGNLGLEDQQAALRWVRRNAAAFGGDPNQVTIMGQSAGGYSVCAHLASPASAGLFHRAIVQSAPCAGAGTHTRAEAERHGIALAARLGCADVHTAARCLRGKSPAELVAAAGSGHDDYRPVVGVELLPLAPARAIAIGRFNRVPVLHGSNHDEEGGRIGGLELMPGGQPLTEAGYVQQVTETFRGDAPVVLARYPVAAFGSPSEALTAVLTDHSWSMPAYDTHRLLTRHVPTYAYEFAERATPWFPGAPRPSFPVGASHMLELPYLFTVRYLEPAAQADLTRAMVDYWARFASTGSPNGPGLPRWPTFHNGQYVQSLAAGGIHGTDFRKDHRYEFWRRLAG